MDHLIADIDEIGVRVEYPDVLRDILDMMDKGIMPDIAEIRNDIKEQLRNMGPPPCWGDGEGRDE